MKMALKFHSTIGTNINILKSYIYMYRHSTYYSTYNIIRNYNIIGHKPTYYR